MLLHSRLASLLAMNPLVCASLTFLLTVSQAVVVEAKGKKSGSKSKRKVSVPLIAGVVVAVVVGTRIPCSYHSFLSDDVSWLPVLILIAIFLYVKKRQMKKRSNPQAQDAPYIGGQPIGPEKQGYSPYPPTQVSTPLICSLDRPDPRFTTAALPTTSGPIQPGTVGTGCSSESIHPFPIFPSCSRMMLWGCSYGQVFRFCCWIPDLHCNTRSKFIE